MNILFSGNDKVLDGVLTCLLSVFMRTESREPFKVYVLTMDVSHIKPEYKAIDDKSIEFLQQVAREYNSKNEIIKVDVTDIYMREFSNCPNEQCYCSPYTLLRLFMDMIPGIPDKVLYLDVDMLFNRDIQMLYNQDVTGYEYAAARDHYGKYLVNPNYINAGMLLFNMNECRRTKLFEKARQLIKSKKLPFADQSAIYRSTTRKKMLPQKYNDQKFLNKKTVLRHFSKRLFWLPYPHTDNIKQWHVSKMYGVFKYYEFDDVLYEYIFLKKKIQHQESGS